MTAYDAMVSILDINESIEELRKRNAGDVPDLLCCKVALLLEEYRELLAREMKATSLQIYQTDQD